MAYLLAFYVPSTHLEAVKEGIFKTGAGELGNYKHCAWQILGEGQYQPNKKALPFKGEANSLSKEPEYKVEIHCRDEIIDDAIKALHNTHPYEVPAYHVVSLKN